MRIAVTGAGGQLGASLARALAGHDAIMLSHDELNVADADACEKILRAAEPDRIIHAAAWTDVDGCENDPDHASRVNAAGARNVAAATDAFVVVVSTDYVFDGLTDAPYVETDATNPVQVYGASKLEGERLAMEVAPARCAIARTAWLYGARTASGAPAKNFVASILRAARKGPLQVVDDQVGSPTSTDDLARALVAMCERPTPGLFHVVNTGATSRFEFARWIVGGAGMDPASVTPVSTEEAPPRPARRPLFAPLDAPAWRAAGYEPLAPIEDALNRAMADILSAQ